MRASARLSRAVSGSLTGGVQVSVSITLGAVGSAKASLFSAVAPTLTDRDRRRLDRFRAVGLHQHQLVGLVAHEAARHEFRRRRRLAGLRRAALVVALAERVMADVGGVDMGEIVAAEIGDRQFAENVIENRSGVLDRVIALHEARRLEAGEGEGVDIFLQRHAILQADRNRDGEIVHQAAEGGAFLVHVDEDLADAAVLIFAGAQIDLVAADHGFLGIALAAVGQLFALAAALDALDDPLDDALGDLRRARRLVLRDESLDRVVLVLVVIGDELRVERLRQFGAVAIERIGLEREAPRQQIGRLAFLDAWRRSAC